MQSLPPQSGWLTRLPKNKLGMLFLLVALLVPLYGTWRWFFCRIEVDSGKAAVLIAKTGTHLPSGQIVATDPGQKGIQIALLPEGRYFRNPFFWDWKYVDVVDIPAGKLAVQLRQYDRDPAQEELQRGQVLAGEGQKGILPQVLMAGQHRLNPYGHEVQPRPAVRIRPGYVGFGTSLVGQEPGGTFAKPGEKGVLKDVLQPGLYYINPDECRQEVANLEAQTRLRGAEM
jgi:hypothetical protein